MNALCVQVDVVVLSV